MLSLIAILSVAIILVPPIYLAVRAGAGEAWELLTQMATLRLIGRTLLLVATVAAGAVLVGVPMAWLVVRTRLPGARWWSAACSLPLAMPSFVAALTLLGAFSPKGFLQQILQPLGVDRLPEIYGLAGATVALVMATFPYVFLLTVTALRGVDPAMEDAARSLGRRPWNVFWTVTVPQIRRAVAGGVLISGLYVLSDYGAVSLMRYDTLTRSIFNRYNTFQPEAAAMLGLLLIGLTVAFLVLEHHARGGRASYRLGPGVQRQSRPLALGRFAPAALGYAGLVVGVFVVVPIAVLVYLVVQAADSDRSFTVPWAEAANSLTLALVVAVIVTAITVPVAVLARRYRRPWTVGLERTAYASNALPGVVVGLALVFVGARYLPGLYQTLPLLVIAYLVRYYAQALTGVDTALASVNPRAEEAARSLGRSPLQVVWSVTLPMMRAGLVSGGTLVFLSVLKELPATLLLRPTGFDTLATVVWTKAQVGRYGEAAVSSLLLLGLAVPFLYLAARDTNRTDTRDPLPAVPAA